MATMAETQTLEEIARAPEATGPHDVVWLDKSLASLIEHIAGHHRGLSLESLARGAVLFDIVGEEKLLDEEQILAVPLKRGDALFMQKLTCHSSLPNNSADIRWSFDLRYQPTGQPSGRPAFPDFVVRSRHNPDSVLTDYHVWIAS